MLIYHWPPKLCKFQCISVCRWYTNIPGNCFIEWQRFSYSRSLVHYRNGRPSGFWGYTPRSVRWWQLGAYTNISPNRRMILQRVRQEKDLGVTIDESLNFEHHILEKVKKANQTVGLIRRYFFYLDIQNFRWLFKAMVRPHLLCGQSIWSIREEGHCHHRKCLEGELQRCYLGWRMKLDLPTLPYRRIREDDWSV